MVDPKKRHAMYMKNDNDAAKDADGNPVPVEPQSTYNHPSPLIEERVRAKDKKPVDEVVQEHAEELYLAGFGPKPAPEFTPLSERKPEPYQLVVVRDPNEIFEMGIINPIHYNDRGVQIDVFGRSHKEWQDESWRAATPADLADYGGEWVESGGKCWVAAEWIAFEEPGQSIVNGIVHLKDAGEGTVTPTVDLLGGSAVAACWTHYIPAEDFHRLPESERGGVV